MAIESTGKFGQIKGPFAQGEDLIQLIKDDAGLASGIPCVELGISYAEKDAMIYGGPVEAMPTSLKFRINGKELWMGRTDIYESDDVIKLTEFTFVNDAPASVLIEYRLYLDK